MNAAIDVSEFRIGALLVPSFRAMVGEHIGIRTGSIPGTLWSELVASLAGLRPRADVRLGEKAGLCIPHMLNYKELTIGKSAARVIQECNFTLPTTSSLQCLKSSAELPSGGQTFWTLALVASAVSDDCKIVLVTSDGLDPRGVRELNATLKQNAGRFLAIHLYSEDVASSVENDAEFSQIVATVVV
jgi:hypothetical protein